MQGRRKVRWHEAEDARSQNRTSALKPRKDMVTICRFWAAKMMTAAANTRASIAAVGAPPRLSLWGRVLKTTRGAPETGKE